jgi:hypothetical protein
MKYIEIWNIEPLQKSIDYFSPLLIVGIVFIVVESIVVFSRKKWGEDSSLFKTLDLISRPKYPYSLIFFPIGIISIILWLFMLNQSKSSLKELKNEIQSSNREVVEGEIKVEFAQPKEGHTDGDIIHVGDKTFEISTFFTSDFYHEAISNGGILEEGKIVRLTFIPTKEFEKDQYGDGKILKIEFKK